MTKRLNNQLGVDLAYRDNNNGMIVGTSSLINNAWKGGDGNSTLLLIFTKTYNTNHNLALLDIRLDFLLESFRLGIFE